MTPREAAEFIGCNLSHLRRLIREGKIRAEKLSTDTNQHGYLYYIPVSEVVRFKSLPVDGRGGRGKKRVTS